MRTREDILDVETTPEVPDLEDVTSYEDGDATVICDRTNPNAWVRSTGTVDLKV